MSFVTFVIGFVTLLLFGLTYVISVTAHAALWMAFVTFLLGMLMALFTVLSWVADYGDQVEDFTDGR